MRILLIEDDDLTREMLASALKQLDSTIEIEAATNGDDGLAHSFEHRHDVVITDNFHPGIHGTELIAMILAKNSSQPVILQTGNIGEHIEAFKQ